MARPRWLFFDVGNTLLSDNYGMSRTYLMLYRAIVREHPTVTFADVMAMREERICRHRDSQPHWSIGIRYFGQLGWMQLRSEILADFDRNYIQYHHPAPGVARVLTDLAKEYRLGVAANQVRACRAALDHFGLLRHMSVVWLSEEVGSQKPDPVFFRGMLDAAGCAAAEAVMVGDRIDFDISPAKALGMRTIQAYHQEESPPEDADEYARMYFASLQRARVAEVQPQSPGETPDAVVTSFAEIPATVRRFG
mgnify:CR=1 FL=1